MTLTQAKKLKVGDRVVWPEGANECAYAEGQVCTDEQYGNLYVKWPDGQRTYLYDADAVKYIKTP